MSLPEEESSIYYMLYATGVDQYVQARNADQLCDHAAALVHTIGM